MTMRFSEHVPRVSERLDTRALSLGAAALGSAAYIRKRQRDIVRMNRARANAHVEVEPHHSDQGDAVFIFDTGLFMDPKMLKNIMGKRVEHLGPSYFMRHAPDVDENRAKELEILEKEKGRRIVTVSTSKGGMDRVRMMADPAFMQEHDYITVASFDSATFKTEHLTDKGHRMARAGLWLEDSYLAAMLFDWHNAQVNKRHDQYEVRRRGSDSFYIAQEDAAVLMTEIPHFTDDNVRMAFSEENVGSLLAIAAKDDDMVNTKAATKWLASVTGRTIDYIEDRDRPVGGHAGISRTPQRQLDEIYNRLYPSEA